jgi:hypothetical protein
MRRIRLAMLVAGALVAVAATAGLAEEKAAKAKLPDAVAKTFATAFPEGVIQKADAEEENGVMVYDLEFKDGDTEKETDIAEDGTMLEFTLVIAADAIPAPVMKTINDAAKGATVGRLEKISVSYETKDGKVVKLPEALTRYAAEMAKGKKTAEVITNADGTVFEAPEWVEPKPEAKAAK